MSIDEISDRTRVEAILRASERLLGSAFALVAVGVWIHRIDGRAGRAGAEPDPGFAARPQPSFGRSRRPRVCAVFT